MIKIKLENFRKMQSKNATIQALANTETIILVQEANPGPLISIDDRFNINRYNLTLLKPWKKLTVT